MHTPEQARADIIRMAREAGVQIEFTMYPSGPITALRSDELFALLQAAAAAEREACAKLLEQIEESYGTLDQGLPKAEYARMKQTAREHAAAIRSRNTA